MDFFFFFSVSIIVLLKMAAPLIRCLCDQNTKNADFKLLILLKIYSFILFPFSFVRVRSRSYLNFSWMVSLKVFFFFNKRWEYLIKLNYACCSLLTLLVLALDTIAFIWTCVLLHIFHFNWDLREVKNNNNI